MSEEIPDLAKILLPKYLPPTKTIERYETKRLTAAGENYGSLMLAVDITIKNINTDKEETINAVAKMVPKNEFVQNMFKSAITFKKELEFYRTIIPTLQQFQRAGGMEEVLDFFPEFYGGRIGSNNSEEYDTDAIILLENLKIKGYGNVERTLGFDLETSKLILRDLAKLHAVPIALKLKKPQVFNEKIKPYLKKVNLFSGIDNTLTDIVYKSVSKIVEEDADCKKHLQAVQKAIKYATSQTCLDSIKPHEPFATINHKDFWVNNTLVKFEENKPVKNTMVDFQIIDYGSPATDLTFFIFDSVQNDVIKNKYDELLDEYYSTFIKTLEKFQVDTEPFSFKAFQVEIARSVKEETLYQCFLMLDPIFASHKDAISVDSMSQEDFKYNAEVSPLYKEKLLMLVKEFVKRQWI